MSPTAGPPPGSDLSSLADGLAPTDGTAGVAVAPLGGEAEAVGTIRTAVAWSTAKVPLAMAALTEHPGARTEQAVARAIRESDNAAAQALWDGWPDPGRAAAAVRSVLRAAGDDRTEVPTTRRREGYTVFGQTEWALHAQAEFGARLACLPHGEDVLDHMRRVTPGQQWGFADPALGDRLEQVAVKGGWGPDPDGGHLVRQLAVVTPRAGAPWAAALAVRPRSGGFGDGTAMLTRLAGRLLDGLTVTGPDRCR